MNKRPFLTAGGGLLFAGLAHSAWKYWPDRGLKNTCAQTGRIDAQHKPFLRALKQHNPLLYDFALKRLLNINGQAFLPVVFATKRIFQRP